MKAVYWVGSKAVCLVAPWGLRAWKWAGLRAASLGVSTAAHWVEPWVGTMVALWAWTRADPKAALRAVQKAYSKVEPKVVP